MLLDTLTGGFGNSINIWFCYRILHLISSLSNYSRGAIKMANFKAKYRQKYITWDIQTTFHWKSNVSPVKLCNKTFGQLKL